jgi:azurin
LRRRKVGIEGRFLVAFPGHLAKMAGTGKAAQRAVFGSRS